MSKSRIEWLRDLTTGHAGFSINPVKGLCPVACDYCYARRLYGRFKWNPEIRFDGNALTDFPDRPSRIFVGSTMELFGDWVKPQWMEQIMALPFNFPQHTFIFLTKRPENLAKFSPFPKNCWVGVTATDEMMVRRAIQQLRYVQTNVQFLSLEPLLGEIRNVQWNVLNWVIIGQRTPASKATMPKIEWVEEIVNACDKASIPIFLKNNLMNMFVYNQQSIMLPYWALNKDGTGGLRQEFPNGDKKK